MLSNAEEQGKRAKIIPGYIRFSLLGITFAVQIYAVITESLHFAWIANLQGYFMDGEHFVMITFLVSFLLAILPVVLIVRFLIPIYERKKEHDEKDILDA